MAIAESPKLHIPRDDIEYLVEIREPRKSGNLAFRKLRPKGEASAHRAQCAHLAVDPGLRIDVGISGAKQRKSVDIHRYRRLVGRKDVFRVRRKRDQIGKAASFGR